MNFKKHFVPLNQPIKHRDHRVPRSRREFISQGFYSCLGSVAAPSLANFLLTQKAHGLSSEFDPYLDACGIRTGAGKIPFICFDLAGGANIAGSNVLVGGAGGQRDFLSTAGYSKQGLPGDMIPGVAEVTPSATSNGDHTDESLGLAFHSDSQFLKGILEKTSEATRANMNGAVIAARSENDTGNNPHNPMYAINLAGASGELLDLCGSRSSESGGNSVSPLAMINPAVRPTKVDRPTDVTGLVNVGDFGLLNATQVVSIMESVARLSQSTLSNIQPLNNATDSENLKQQLQCAYIKSAYLAEQFPDASVLDPLIDTDIVNTIFSDEELRNDREFSKTASIMKLVINGYSGAGTITMGGYDYHTGDRGTGEVRDLRAGRCMGACLEYAARKQQPLMMYVFSDGSVFSNGMTDESEAGRGKGVWTGDSQQTGASFFLVYNPRQRPTLRGSSAEQQLRQQQIGYMRPSGDVETASSPCANNVNLLVQTIMLNYMALHGEQGQFTATLEQNGLFSSLGNAEMMDSLIAFEQL